MSKHTPGVWKQSGPVVEARGHVRTANGQQIAYVHGHCDSEAAANARLIAAAPQLLEAASEAVAEWDAQHADDNHQTGIWPEPESIRRCRAAIAAAEGGKL
jgi:hypothetical protein